MHLEINENSRLQEKAQPEPLEGKEDGDTIACALQTLGPQGRLVLTQPARHAAVYKPPALSTRPANYL